MKLKTHKTLALLMFVCTLALTATQASAQADFSGTFKGSYELGEASATINITATLTPRANSVRVRWREQTTFEGGGPDPADVSVVTGTLKGNSLRFFVPTKGNRRLGTTYTAAMDGDTLVVRFTLYYDPQGAYSVSPCKGCQRAPQEIRMTRQ